jgi:aldehyde oxidoreductase
VPIGTLAAGIGMAPSQIRVIENPTGASFGYSITPAMSGIVAVCTLAPENL